MRALKKLPRAAKMALAGGLFVVLALVGKGLAPGGDAPVGVTSAPVTRRAATVVKPKGPTTTTTTPGPLNPTGRNPFTRAK